MRWLIPKTYLKWREPKIIRQAREVVGKKSLAVWVRPLLVVVAAGLFMTTWYLATLDPNKDPLPVGIALLVALMGGITFVYLVPWVLRFCPSEIRVTEKAITRVIGNHAAIWQYKKIKSCLLVSRELEGECYSLLAIRMNNGATSLLGIDPSVSLDELQRVLRGRRVEVEFASDSKEELLNVPNLL